MYKVISIAGSSGVGKTTLAKLFRIHFGESIHLTGDNYHKWERDSHNWKEYTHLDPAANKLEDAASDLSALKEGKTISLAKYSHKTGKFCPSEEIESKGVIIHEGLHALYSPELCSVADLKIFVDTDEDLKLEWKLERDTKDRGYSRREVLQAIHNRQSDEITYIDPQKNEADIVVWFKKCNDEVMLEYTVIKDVDLCNDLMYSLTEIYNQQQTFVTSTEIEEILNNDDEKYRMEIS